MRLLTPGSIQQIRDREAQERKDRLQKLSAEEARLINSVNALQETEIKERERVNAALDSLRTSLVKETNLMKSEVSSLEERRRKALAPIEAERAVADKNVAYAKRLEAEVHFKLQDVQNKEKEGLARETQIASQEDEIASRLSDIESREMLLESAENNAKTTLDTARRAQEKVTEANGALSEREKALQERYEALATAEKGAQARADEVMSSAMKLLTGVQATEKRLIEKEKEIEESIKEASQAKTEAQTLLSDARIEREEAKKALAEATQIHETAMHVEMESGTALLKKKAELDERERQVIVREDENKTKTDALEHLQGLPERNKYLESESLALKSQIAQLAAKNKGLEKINGILEAATRKKT